MSAIGGGPVLRVVLIGLMGAGKSTVGPLLARALGWGYLDLDEEIERRAGRSVREIFASAGETAFRRLESEGTAALAHRREVVIAAGGGWIATPGNLARLGSGTLSVWLQVTPEAAVERLASEADTRPLLNETEPLVALRRLQREREAHYRRAELHVPTDRHEPAEIAREIAQFVRVRAGGPGQAETRE